MVWKASEDLDEDKKQGEEGQPQATAGQVLSSPSAGGNTGQATGSTTTPQSQRSSGSFTNLQSYIGANTGADKNMVGRVGNTVDNVENKATTAGQTVRDTANTAITAGTINDDGDVLDTIQGATNRTPPPTETQRTNPTAPTPQPASQTGGRGGKGAMTVPTSASTKEREPQPVTQPAAPAPSLKDVDAKEFAKLYNAEYKGPESADKVDGYGDADQAFMRLGQYAGLAGGDISDRGVLLDDTFATSGQQYSQGERMLDSFLLGAGSEAETLANIAQNAQNTAGTWNTTKADINTQIEGGKQSTKEFQDRFREEVGKVFGNVEGRLDSAATSAINTDKAGREQYKKALAGDAQALKAYGLDDATIAAMLANNVDIGKVLEGTIGYGVGDLAESADINAYQSLIDLISGAGGDPSAKYKDFTKKGGNTIKVKDAAKEALGKLVGLEENKKKIAAENAENKKLYDKSVQILSKLNSAYGGTGPTDEELFFVANVFKVDPNMLFSARDSGEMINIDEMVKRGPEKAVGDAYSAEEAAALTALINSLGGSVDLSQSGAAGVGTLSNLPQAQAIQEEIEQVAASPNKQNLNKAYNTVTALWPKEARDAMPKWMFESAINKMGTQAGQAFASIEGLRETLNPKDFAMTMYEFADTFANSRDPRDIFSNIQSMVGREGKTAITGIKKSNDAIADLTKELNPF